VREVHARITSIIRGASPGPPAALRLRKCMPDDETAWEEVDVAPTSAPDPAGPRPISRARRETLEGRIAVAAEHARASPCPLFTNRTSRAGSRGRLRSTTSSRCRQQSMPGSKPPRRPVADPRPLRA
jgi:hypothetical protein